MTSSRDQVPPHYLVRGSDQAFRSSLLIWFVPHRSHRERKSRDHAVVARLSPSSLSWILRRHSIRATPYRGARPAAGQAACVTVPSSGVHRKSFSHVLCGSKSSTRPSHIKGVLRAAERRDESEMGSVSVLHHFRALYCKATLSSVL